MFKIKNLLSVFLLLIFIGYTTGCAKYSDYSQAYSTHVTKDKERIDAALSGIDSVYESALSSISDTPDYVVELTLFDASGREVPLKVKDVSKVVAISDLNRVTQEKITLVSKATVFNLSRPVTVEDIGLATVNHLPIFFMADLGKSAIKNAGVHMNASGGSAIANAPGAKASGRYTTIESNKHTTSSYNDQSYRSIPLDEVD